MKLADGDLLRLLPDHISGDPQFAATGHALNQVFGDIVRAIPNQLIWARLGGQKPETFLPPLRRLTEARPGLKPLSIDELEALAWQFHVDFREVAKTPEMLAELVLNSIAWHRIKGTPKSMYDALKLCGFGTRYSQGEVGHDYGIFIEEGGPQVHWASYQLGFEEIATIEDLKAIVKICREMQPARCRLWRVYTFDFDMRPGQWSGQMPQNAWSCAWWSLWSGSYMEDIPGMDERGLLVSWGKRQRILCDAVIGRRRVACFKEDLAVYRIFFRNFPSWSCAWWSREPAYTAPAFVFWNAWGILIGELMGGEPWADLPWQNKNWGGVYRNLAGNFHCLPISINTLLVRNPDYWPCWPEEVWPDGNWLYGRENGWTEKLWPGLPWDFDLRLINPRPVAFFGCEFATTFYEPNLQEVWPDRPWQGNWRSLHSLFKKALFQGGQIQCVQIGEPVWQENHWSDEVWPERVWTDSWQLAATQNLAGDCAFCAWDCFTDPAFPEGCFERWPDSEWQELAWDDSFRQIKPEIRTIAGAILGSVANSDSAQPQWLEKPWADEVWFSPKVTGQKTSFKILSEISPEASWLELPWPDCAWQSNLMEDV